MILSKKTKTINKRLFDAGIKLTIVECNGDDYVLSNGRVVDRILFINRSKKKHYLLEFDTIYGNDLGEAKNIIQKLKSAASRKGGIKVQEMYPEIRKQAIRNLRKANETGTSWKHIVENGSWSKGKTKNDHPSLKRLSERRKGKGNHRWGKHQSKEARQKQSETMRKKIKSGEFTPNLHNSKTHWQVEYNGKKYRSSWEAAFHHVYPHYEYETLRFSINGRICIVDFYDPLTKKAVEIKPRRFQQIQKKKLKKILEHAKCQGIDYLIVGEEFLIDKWDIIKNIPVDDKTKSKLEKAYRHEIAKTQRN